MRPEERVMSKEEIMEWVPSSVFTKPKLWQIPQPSAAAYQRLPEKTAALRRRLQDIYQRHGRVKLASSLAAEDMVLTDLLAAQSLRVEVFVLETGRLNRETLALADEVSSRYPDLNLRLYYPDAEAVAAYVNEFGANAFYDSVALRRQCCHIRKVEPLNRALADADAWITG